MAKDPAINWYFDNWIGGTKGFNRIQKACYFDLLALQYYVGSLSLQQIKNELDRDFHHWEVIKVKFKMDEDGNYSNERLSAEVRKRREYSESRSKNRSKKDMNNISGRHEKHINNIPETGIKTEIDFVKEFSIEHCLEISFRDERWFRANKTTKDELENFNEYLVKQGIYTMNPAEYKKYFGKLKSKYPDFIKKPAKELSLDDLKKMAEEMDKKQIA